MNFNLFFKSKKKHKFHLVESSLLPVVTGFSAMLVAMSLIFYWHRSSIPTVTHFDGLLMQVAFFIFVIILFCWFITVIKESEQGGLLFLCLLLFLGSSFFGESNRVEVLKKHIKQVYFKFKTEIFAILTFWNQILDILLLIFGKILFLFGLLFTSLPLLSISAILLNFTSIQIICTEYSILAKIHAFLPLLICVSFTPAIFVLYELNLLKNGPVKWIYIALAVYLFIFWSYILIMLLYTLKSNYVYYNGQLNNIFILSENLYAQVELTINNTRYGLYQDIYNISVLKYKNSWLIEILKLVENLENFVNILNTTQDVTQMRGAMDTSAQLILNPMESPTAETTTFFKENFVVNDPLAESVELFF